MCSECYESRNSFFRKSDASVNIRSEELKLKTNNIFLTTPSKLLEKIGIMAKDRKTEIRMRSKARKKLEALSSSNSGDVLESDYLGVFGNDMESLAKKHFDSEKVSDSSIQRYIFSECIMNARKAKANGNKSVRYSFLLLRFAISLRLKLGNDTYEYLAKTFKLPSGRTINQYAAPSTNAPDGVLYESLTAERTKFDGVFPDAVPDDWRRHGTLSWDSMAVKEKIVFNVHTMRIVGFAHDAFDIDIIKKEMEDQLCSDSQNKRPPLAKHFLVFIFTLFETKNCPKFSVIAARYACLTLNSTFILEKLLKVTSALARFGFIVIILNCDGATENRSANKQLATLSIADVLIDPIQELCPQLLKRISLDFKCAFYHPTVSNKIIFISSDMPHFVKNFVNVLERS